MLVSNQATRVADCTDGTSNTIMVAEQSGLVGTDDFRNGYFTPWGGTTLDKPIASMAAGADAWGMGLSCVAYANNSKTAAAGADTSYVGNSILNSFHTGGITVLMTDGSVRYPTPTPPRLGRAAVDPRLGGGLRRWPRRGRRRHRPGDVQRQAGARRRAEPPRPDRAAASGKVEAGRFTVTGPLAAGDYQAFVTPPPPQPQPPGKAAPKAAPLPLPPRFRDPTTSGVVVTLKAGKNETPIEFKD